MEKKWIFSGNGTKWWNLCFQSHGNWLYSSHKSNSKQCLLAAIWHFHTPSGCKYHSYMLFLFGASLKQGFCNNKFIPNNLSGHVRSFFMRSRGWRFSMVGIFGRHLDKRILKLAFIRSVEYEGNFFYYSIKHKSSFNFVFKSMTQRNFCREKKSKFLFCKKLFNWNCFHVYLVEIIIIIFNKI